MHLMHFRIFLVSCIGSGLVRSRICFHGCAVLMGRSGSQFGHTVFRSALAVVGRGFVRFIRILVDALP